MMAPMLTIDGSLGEGGGQILRSALALSVCLRRPFRIVNIRARRPKPGLRPQHLAALRAAAEIAGARVNGATLGAQTLTFEPGDIEAGAHRFAIGTAGSTMLVLQTVLPALLTASSASDLRLEGGTHNPRAPTFECLARAYLPLIGRMGPRIAIELERAGFEPAGGGAVRVRIEPAPRLDPLHLETRGALVRVAAEVLLSKLPAHIAEREATTLANELDIRAESVRIRSVDDSPGPGNVVSVLVESEHVTEVFAEFGRRGVPAERVAQRAALAAKRYLESDVPVGVHLADQLLLPLALAGGGSFVTLPPSAHTRTNIAVIQAFLPVALRCAALDETGRWKIEAGQRTD
jgi:RNA 3'-terminal phosphate cyclase (ATP)